jgi:membrane-associated protein
VSLATDQLLTWLLLYGYPILFAVVLAGSIGLPMPTNLLVLAAGGFVAEGELDLVAVVALVLSAAVLGDAAAYLLARWAGEEVVHRHGGRVGLGPARLAAARGRFGRWLGLSVFVTRWLVTPLALPATVVAAVSRYPAPRFAAAAVGGEALWTLAYVGLGYVFGESWSGVADWVQDSAGLLAGLGVAGIAAALLWLLLRARPAQPAPVVALRDE